MFAANIRRITWQNQYDEIFLTNNPKVVEVCVKYLCGLVALEDGSVLVQPIYHEVYPTDNPKVMRVRLWDKIYEVALSE